MGLNSKEFGLHSLRSGGATVAANAGVPDRLRDMGDGCLKMQRRLCKGQTRRPAKCYKEHRSIKLI